MCRPCTHIIIIQIMKDSANLHFITIYKHEMDLKLHALTFKVERRLQVDILKCYFLMKYNLIINSNILHKLFITKVFLCLNRRPYKDDEPQQLNFII
jgi:hypothetical protein